MLNRESDHYEIWHAESKADPLFFVFLLGIVPWSNPWTVLDEQYVQMRVLAQGGAMKYKYSSFHPL